MRSLIHARVEATRQGRNPYVICQLGSGWAVMGDVQPLPGYCLLLADPVVESLNALSEPERAAYALDCARIGDALLAATDAYRINYETHGNSEPALHTHIIPRFLAEPEPARRLPAGMSYDWRTARRFDEGVDGPLRDRLRAALAIRG